jgi:hypothetical protein
MVLPQYGTVDASRHPVGRIAVRPATGRPASGCAFVGRIQPLAAIVCRGRHMVGWARRFRARSRKMAQPLQMPRELQ